MPCISAIRTYDHRPDRGKREKKACFPARVYVGDGGFHVGGDGDGGAPHNRGSPDGAREHAIV